MCTGLEPAMLILGGLKAAGTIAQGRAAARQAEYQASLYDRQAQRARDEAAARAAEIRRQRSHEQATLRARLAASGVDTAAGSPLLALENRAGDAQLEALTAINSGDYRAGTYAAGASLASYRAREAQRQARSKAGTQLLGAFLP